MTLWEDSSLWTSLMRALHDKKAYEESHRQKKYQEIEKVINIFNQYIIFFSIGICSTPVNEQALELW